MRLSLGLQLGGAVGNLVDRLRFGGAVVDLFYIRPFPVFNIADFSIVTGVALLMWLLSRTAPKEPNAVATAPVESREKTDSSGN